MTELERQPETKKRLLDVACDVFAECGFKNARVRDICTRAKANVAAVNYHFGDKKGLYEAVLQHAFFEVTGSDLTFGFADESKMPDQRLRDQIRTLLNQLLSEGRAAFYIKIVGRELVDPTPAVERIIEEGIRPQVNILFQTLREIAGDRVSDQQIRRCAASIFGQCLFYFFVRPVVLQIPFERKLGPSSVHALAEHITEFSLAALKGLPARQHEKVRRN